MAIYDLIDPSLPVVAVVFLFKDDPGGEWQRAYAMPYDKRLWLVANWLGSNDTGMRHPGQLIPMDRFPHHFCRPDGAIEIMEPIPKELLSLSIPEELKRVYGVVDYPGLLHIPGPPSSH